MRVYLKKRLENKNICDIYIVSIPPDFEREEKGTFIKYGGIYWCVGK